MTVRSDLDRELAAYLEARQTSRAPDGLREAVLAELATTKQRPAWMTRERWLRAEVVDRFVPTRRALGLIALLGLLVALAIAFVLVAGSRPRLPPPLGLARPGLIEFDEGGDLYVVKPDGTGRTQITSGPDVDDRAVWSPDGTMIAYLSERADLSTAVVVVSSDGRRHVTLAENLADVGNLAWSTDSTRVAFGGRFDGDHLVHIYVGDATLGGVVQLGGPNLFANEPSWSPDDQQIAFKRIDPTADDALRATGELWLMGSDGSNPHRLSSLGGGQNALVNTAWSPDGKSIAFLATINSAYDIFEISSDGRVIHNISESPETEFWPSWSPDGTRIAFPRMSLTGVNQGILVVVDPDGSHPVTPPGPPVNSNTAVWSPDGKQLLAYAKDPDPSRDFNVALAIFDPSGRMPAISIPEAMFTGASWQRLAP